MRMMMFSKVMPKSRRSAALRLLTLATAALLSLAVLPGLSAQQERLSVVATTTDLAYIAAQVGGDRVETSALLSGREDPHFARARPDYIVRLNRADLFIEVGMELEAAWSSIVRDSSRNKQIIGGGRGYVDASVGIRVLERPKTRVTRAMGDVHGAGNPHYWTDPLNAVIIARNIRDALIRINPASKPTYQQNYLSFHERMKQLTIREARKFAPYKGLRVAVFHREFAYLAQRFGFEVVDSIEEIPGVPPSAARLREVSELLKSEGVRIILMAPYNDPGPSESVAERIGAKLIRMPISVASEPGMDTYEQTIEAMLERIRAAADATK